MVHVCEPNLRTDNVAKRGVWGGAPSLGRALPNFLGNWLVVYIARRAQHRAPLGPVPLGRGLGGGSPLGVLGRSPGPSGGPRPGRAYVASGRRVSR